MEGKLFCLEAGKPVEELAKEFKACFAFEPKGGGPRYFRISYSGWECYKPIDLFKPGATEKDFLDDVRSVLPEAVKKLITKCGDANFISGDDLQEAIVEELERKGWKRVGPWLEIDLRGEAFYRSEDDLPPILRGEPGKTIIEHNARVWDKRQAASESTRGS